MYHRLVMTCAAFIIAAVFLSVTQGYGAELSIGDPTADNGSTVFFPIGLSVTSGDDDIVGINIEITHSADLVFQTVTPSQEIIDAGKTAASSTPSATTVRVVVYDLINTIISDGPLFYIGFTPSEDAINGDVVNLSVPEAVASNDQAQEVPLISMATFSKSIDHLFTSPDPDDPDPNDPETDEDTSGETPVIPDNDDGSSGTPSSLAEDDGGGGGCFIGYLMRASYRQ